MTPQERDLAIRVVLAEAAKEGPQGMAAVAHVIRNRVATGSYGDGLGGVLTKKYAFEPMLHYGTGKNNDPARFKEAEPVYQEAARIFDAVSAGGVADPTKGATHFLAKGLQSDLGRDTPAWAKKPLTQIGGHTFYSPDIDPEHVRNYAAISTPNKGGGSGGTDAIAEFLNKSPAGGSPAGANPMSSVGLSEIQALLQGMQQKQQQPSTPLIPRMLFGDQGINGLMARIPTPNDGKGFLGGMFGGPTYPQDTSAPSVPAVPGGATALPPGLSAPPVTPVQSSPLPAPSPELAAASVPQSGMRTAGWPPAPPAPAAGGSIGSTIGGAIKNGIFSSLAPNAASAAGPAMASALPAAASAAAPAAAATTAAAAPAAMSSLAALFAAI